MQHLMVEESGGVTVATFVEPHLVEENVEAMRGEVLRLLEGRRQVVLDLSRVTFVSSAGLGLIVLAGRKLSGQGGRIAVCGVRPKVARLFTGPPRMLKDFPRYPDRDAAVAAMTQTKN